MMKKLLVGLSLLTTITTYASGKLSCVVDVDGNYIEGSLVAKEITQKSASINNIGDEYSYYVSTTAEGGFGELSLVDKVTGFKAESSDISSGFASRIGEDTEVMVELKNKNGGILGNKELKNLRLTCSIDY